MRKIFEVSSPNLTEKLGEEVGKRVKSGDIISYTGSMGMGKTTFTRGLAKGMKITEDVLSPTFALVNEYRGEGLNLYHFDMYRVETFEDLYSTGFFDYMDMGGVLAIEWSENIQAVLPENIISVDITANCEGGRNITLQGDERFEDISC